MKHPQWFIIPVLVSAGTAAGLAYGLSHRANQTQQLVIYGNVDLRQVELPFNDSQRITTVLVQEGDRVRKGQALALLDTSRLEPQVAQAEAQVAAQRAAVDRLHNGSRPEEIAQARANVEQAKADAANAQRVFERKRDLLNRAAGSQQDFDNAKAARRTAYNNSKDAADMAEARVDLNQKALDLAVAGPRREDIAQAEAQLRGNEAQLTLLRAQLADAELKAPTDAVIRSRLMEPGDMASPQ